MDAYTSFADVYDLFMEDVPYRQWRDLIINELKQEQITEGLVLDLGCGTGTMTRLMTEAGYDLIGVDGSEEMLMIAREKTFSESEHRKSTREQNTSEILYLCQDMREFELYGTVRAVISCCDTMNYLLTKEDLVQVMKLVNNYLDPGGLFLFDVNTIYKFQKIMGNQSFCENREGASFIWENYYDEEQKRNEYDLTLFIQQENGLFERVQELHQEQGYTLEEWTWAIEQAGMELLKIIDADTGQTPAEDTTRLFFVTREHGKVQSGRTDIK